MRRRGAALDDVVGAGLETAQRCPRCFYDLSGHVSTWVEQCPTAGLCSECGLTFEWASLLNPARRDVRWLYEHSRRWWNVRSAWSTAVRALAPWWFWRRVELHHRVAVVRLVLWLPLLLASLLALLTVVAAARGGLVLATAATPLPLHITRVLTPISGDVSAKLSADGATLTIRRSGMTEAIVIDPNGSRAPAIHTLALGRVLVLWSSHRNGWSMQTSLRHGPPDQHGRRGLEIVERTMSDPIGRIHHDLIAIELLSPSRPPAPTLTQLFLAPTLTACGISGFDDLTEHVFARADGPNKSMLLPPAFSLMATILILVCPSQWKAARVKWPHLMRVAIVSLAPIAIIFMLAIAARVWAIGGYAYSYAASGGHSLRVVAPPLPPGWLARFAATPHQPVLFWALALWMPVYWWFAMGRGMKLEQPRRLWIFIVIAGWLAMVNSLFLFDRWAFFDTFM